MCGYRGLTVNLTKPLDLLPVYRKYKEQRNILDNTTKKTVRQIQNESQSNEKKKGKNCYRLNDLL